MVSPIPQSDSHLLWLMSIRLVRNFVGSICRSLITSRKATINLIRSLLLLSRSVVDLCMNELRVRQKVLLAVPVAASGIPPFLSNNRQTQRGTFELDAILKGWVRPNYRRGIPRIRVGSCWSWSWNIPFGIIYIC